jgi:hypothetical protein
VVVGGLGLVVLLVVVVVGVGGRVVDEMRSSSG